MECHRRIGRGYLQPEMCDLLLALQLLAGIDPIPPITTMRRREWLRDSVTLKKNIKSDFAICFHHSIFHIFVFAIISIDAGY